MKLLSKITFTSFLLFIIASNIFAQFVSLDGKQFKLSGNNFYPVVMNYNIAITHNPSTSDYYATPSGSYGPLPYYECNDAATCDTRFQIEFAKIASMGFNAIRIGFGPTYHEGATIGSRVFSMQFNDNLGANQWRAGSQFRDLSYPNFNDQASTDFFNIIKDVLTQAGSAGLKVILLTGSPGPRNATTGVPMYNFVYDQQAANDYAVYLSKLASELASYPALLAYDLFNEPIYNDMYYGFPNGVQTEWKKQDICAFERQWYDAIKPTNDPNHLVTIGCASTDEVFYWDMGNLKLDFFSLHNYPNYNKFIYPSNIQQSIQDGMDKFKNIMYWMSQVCPIPWIVGETGFSADDYTNDPDHLDGDPNHHIPPFMYGSETQQQQFAQQSLDDVRNAGASGYSWWAFQNVHWFSYNLPHPSNYPDCMNEDYFGLLHYGDGTTNWLDKLAIPTFQSYLTNGQPPAIAPLQEPSNYHDTYNIHAVLNTSATNAISGYVYDDKGNPIKDAVVYGSNWLWTTTTLPHEYHFDSPFTFTDINGYFQIVPYNYYQQNVLGPNRIVNIKITAVGAERDCEGSCGWPYGDVKMTQTSFPSISLQKITTGYDAIASNETVNVGETRNYYGWNSLTAFDLNLNGNSNLTARNEINVNSEFHASSGSEVHIFISNGYTDCNDFTGFARLANPSASNTENEVNSSKEIEVTFIDSKTLNAQIYPNPNNGIFTISIQNPEMDLVSLKLQNLLSETLWSTQTNSKDVLANFDFLPKGIYLMQIKNQKQSVTKKLIIN